MSNTHTSIHQFFKQFPSDNACLQHLFTLRFTLNPTCPKCKTTNAKWYKLTKEKAYSCGNCGHHIHPMVGTLFENSRTSLQLWFYAIYLFSTTRSGVSAKELQRQLGVTYKCAWRMGHQIRQHMGKVDKQGPIGGGGRDVEIDEGFFGGEGNKKTMVLGMAEKDGAIKTKVIKENAWFNINNEIIKNVKRTSTVHTDEAQVYDNLKRMHYIHKPKNHTRDKEWNTPTLDSYWTRLKMSIKGTHVWVSAKYLDKYADEFAYRFNRRHHPETMFDDLLGNFL